MKPFEIANPCHESWNDMRREAGAARHCASCQERVYDLALMTESEIRGLAVLKGGSFCGRQQTVGGQLLVRPPAPAARPQSPFAWRLAQRGAIVAGMTGALAAAACDVPSAHAGGPVPRDPIVEIHVDPNGNPAPTPEPTPTPDPIPEPDHEPEMGKIAYRPPDVDRDLLFAPGKATLEPSAKMVLEDVVAALRFDTEAPVTITGHATATELGKRSGATLARKRAEAVRDFLATKGIAKPRLKIVIGGAATSPKVEVHSDRSEY